MTKAAIIKLADYKAKMGGAGISAQTHNEGMADKLAKDSVEVEKKNLTATEILNTSLKNLTEIIKQQMKESGGTGAVGEKADRVKSYKGAGGAVKERVDDFKKLFTLRGFLDKTGIVKKGSTGMFSGIADAALEKREAKQQYVKDRLNVDKNYVKGIGGGVEKASKTFGNQFEKGNDALVKVQDNNKELSRLRDQGFSESQVGRSSESTQQAGLAADLAQKDSRFRDGITPSGKPRVERSSKSNVVDIDKFKKEKKEQGNAVADAMSSSEEELENGRKMDSQLELLSKIEENTRGEGGSEKKETKPEGGGFLGNLLGGPKKFITGLISSLMGALSSIGGMLMTGITSAFKFLFNPKMLLKIFSKVLAPLAIVGALVNGIMDGFNTFMETGSITEALIAGLGGILDFLTFGLIDAKVIKELVDWAGETINEYIFKPFENFFSALGDGIMSLFDGFKNFEIPGFSVLGKQFGPWHPFKSESKDSGGSSSTPASAATVSAASPEAKKITAAVATTGKVEGDKAKLSDKVAADSKEVEAGKTTPAATNVTTVVNNSKVSNQKSTTAVASPSPRNSDNPTNDYLRKRSYG
jgi:hypothetical protein